MCTLVARDLNATIMSVRRLRIDATLLRECEFTMAWNMRSSLRSLRRLNSRALMVVARVSVRQREGEQAPRAGGPPLQTLASDTVHVALEEGAWSQTDRQTETNRRLCHGDGEWLTQLMPCRRSVVMARHRGACGRPPPAHPTA